MTLRLHEFHERLGARFMDLGGGEAIADFGDVAAEYAALTQGVGALDLSFRSRLCLTGRDRARFLHGQVTNDVARLQPGRGCYAALITAKGKMQSDLNVHCLEEELLLDFEPGLAGGVMERLEKYIIADDVQVLNVAEAYGLLSLQGPNAEQAIRDSGIFGTIPREPYAFVKRVDSEGDIVLANHARLGTSGFDVFAPAGALAGWWERLVTGVQKIGGRPCGWKAFEIARIEAGIPRFGVDMDPSNIPLECGLEERAVSFNKGCYIGQEVISRIHTYGQVAKALRRLRLSDNLTELPARGDKLFQQEKEVGYITSATASLSSGAKLALGYVRKEVNQIGSELILRGTQGESAVRVSGLPFGR